MFCAVVWSVVAKAGPVRILKFVQGFILDGQMAMSLVQIPFIEPSHAIPYPFVERSVAKRSAGISKFDQVEFHRWIIF